MSEIPRYTAEQLQALINIQSKGLLSVQFGDRVMRYQDAAALENVIAAARRDVSEAARIASGQPPFRRHLTHGRGY
jgi:hypothetical protein